MRLMGLRPGVIAVTAFCVTSQAYAPPLNIATGPHPNVDIQSNALGLTAPVAAAGSGPLCPPDATGDCCQAPGGPGCNDPVCCELVCSDFAPLCCDFGWFQPCADAAVELCGCEPPCPPDAGDPTLEVTH